MSSISRLFHNLRSGVLFFGGARKKSNARLTGQSAVSQAFIVRREKVRLIHLLHESSAASPESGLLSDWSKNKRVFDGTFQLVHDCMFDFRCNFN